MERSVELLEPRLWLVFADSGGKGIRANIPKPVLRGSRGCEAVDNGGPQGRQACGEFSFLFDVTDASNHISAGGRRLNTKRKRYIICAVRCLVYPQGKTHLRSSSLVDGPYRKPHPDSEVNSLWSMAQCDQGKSAKQMRNFGRSIGSKGWMADACEETGFRAVALTDGGFGCPCRCCGFSGGNAVMSVIANSQPGTVAEKGNPTV